jgi:hypothetical protein
MKGNIMADSSPLDGLLDRAGNVFSLAGKLGRAFQEEGQSRAVFFDPSIWKRHEPTFNEFCEELLELRDATQKPPDGFEPVAAQLLAAARLAKRLRDCLSSEAERDRSSWKGQPFGQMLGVKNPRPPAFTAYWEFFPDLNSVFENGWRAVNEVTAARRLDDPFAFVDEPGFSLLDRFPATPAGNVAFLESVCDEVCYAADSKRGQLERGYSNATIENTVRGIKWAEARTRLAALPGLPNGIRSNLDDILHRELTAGTVDQIALLLKPAVWGVRNSLEHARLAELERDLVVVTTVGDLWKTYAEGKRPCIQCSGIAMRPGANTPAITCTDGAAEAKRTALDLAQALVTAEGGDKAEAMERLIARVQLQTALDKVSVINMPLADFVAAAMGRSQANEMSSDPAIADQPSDSAKGNDAGRREAKTAALNPAERKAYFAFELAQQKAGRQLADREAYDDLKEHGLLSGSGDLGELTDYVVPAFDTWSRYLRGARNALGKQKYTRRASRPRGGSIVSADEIERQTPES